MPNIDDIQAEHSKYLDSMLETFEAELQKIINKAETALLAKLQRRLSITDGVIDQTPGNLKLMRRADKMFMEELTRAGYRRLMDAFVGEFRGQISFLEDIIQDLSDQMKEPLRKLTWSQQDLNVLANFQASSVDGITSAVAAAASAAKNRVMLSIGGLDFKELVSTLREAFDLTVARAKTLAETSMMMFYRTASDLAYQDIEKDLPQQEQRYIYSGPDDAKTRPFCEEMLARTEAEGYTRAQIDELDNGQLPNVWITQGGWNCRHQWLLDIRNLEKRLLKAA